MSPTPDHSDASDQDLVARILQGDEAAFTELHRRYEGSVLRKIFGIVRHQERAEDLTQETFRKVTKNLNDFQPEQEFGPWINTIAKNTARDYVKRLVFRSNSPGARSVGRMKIRAPEVDDSSDSTEPRPDTAEFAQALEVALSQLKPHHRRAFVLFEMEGRDYDDIADMMGVSTGTVGSYLNRARKNLRRKLQPFLDARSGGHE